MKATTTVLLNGIVVTLDPHQPHAEAVALSGDQITAVGSNEEILELRAPYTEQVDLQGGALVPGFIESHLHLVAGGRSLIELQLQGCASPAELSDIVRGAAQDIAPGNWIIGHGWEDAAVGGATPNRSTLDALAPNHPVLLTRRDGHALWLNSKAIQRLKVDRIQPASPDEMPRDTGGNLMGVLFEGSVVETASRLHSVLPRSYIKKAMTLALNTLVQAGITTAHDIVTTYPSDLLLYRSLLNQGNLPLRIIASPSGTRSMSTVSFGLLRVLNKPLLRIGPRKYFLDGSFGASTALLSKPYANDPAGVNTGMCTLAEEQLQAIFDRSFDRLDTIVVHAIGDRAVELALTAQEHSFAHYGKRVVRNRLEHVQIVDPAIIPRFRKAGLIASFQPVFLYELDMTRQRLGDERLAYCYLLRDFLDAGVPVIFSSDWPYGGGDYPLKADGSRYHSFEPLLGIHASIDRLGFDHSQALTVEEALAAYTRTAAWAHHDEDSKGTIAPGKLADLTLLSQDITQIPTEAILETEVLMTMVGGKIAFAG